MSVDYDHLSLLPATKLNENQFATAPHSVVENKQSSIAHHPNKFHFDLVEENRTNASEDPH